jgi:hypothetical protein
LQRTLVRRTERPRFELRGESGERLAEPALDLVNPVLEENERALDVLEREPGSHHLLDGVDAPNGLHRIDAVAAAMLALAPDAAAAR